MTHQESASKDLKNATQILSLCAQKSLSAQEREEKAVELAALLLKEANRTIRFSEKMIQKELARMMRDPMGKVFTMAMTDQCFRSKSYSRVANQMVHLLDEMGIPQYLGFSKRAALFIFQAFGKTFPWIFVPLSTLFLRKATSRVILPGEKKQLKNHMKKRREEGVRLNLNHLGEAILGEKEAKRRLEVYLQDLTQEDIEYISVKISTIYSQIHLLGWDKTVEVLADRLRALYRVGMRHQFVRRDGSKVPKFVNLDMEEYRDLHLTKELFQKVLNEPEFLSVSAGIVLQAYLPDSFEIQKELTEFAKARRRKGGAPIKIRIVKGANLAMEQFEASLRLWKQTPYTKKSDVDANYKLMVTYGAQKENAESVHLGIASHNLFDIAYALLLRAENGVEKEVNFEMLEGMADHMRRVVQKLSSDILLYCPVATKEDFQSAIAYLIRRLDENTGPDNFLRVTFGLTPGTQEWKEQVDLFTKSCREMKIVPIVPRRAQNRLEMPEPLLNSEPFDNESDTDFSLKNNRDWAKNIVERWKGKQVANIPLVIAGKEHHEKEPKGKGINPSDPSLVSYRYSLADSSEVEEAIVCAKKSEKSWQELSYPKKREIFSTIAQKMRENRGDLIGVMMLDGAKSILEGDVEVSEAIDFAEYYLRSMDEMRSFSSLEWEGKGTVLVTPPWNFPVSIPAGGILAALAAGNSVLFKPAPEAVLSGFELVKLFWEAGVPKEVLQFLNCVDEPIGSSLIKDPRINSIILTGATSTAKLFMRLRPGVDLHAETGGKNAMIVTALADRDLAIKDAVSAAFHHAGQKCSACSLLILEKEVYRDKHFLEQLKDAAESLKVGTPWDLSAKVTPLIRKAEGALLRALTELDSGEKWLVVPKQDPHNPHLWSPGIKMGVKRGSFSHQTEFFGPVLSIMCAKNLYEAIEIANETVYGLTSGLQSLDNREQAIWKERIVAGNLYINRGITGAIVRRQPFGGTKGSSFGGGAKAGGPNYVMQFATVKEKGVPEEKAPLTEEVNRFSSAILQHTSFSKEELGLFYASLANYAYWIHHFREPADPSKVLGQDNLLCYTPHTKMAFRVQKEDRALDIFQILGAAITCQVRLEVSFPEGRLDLELKEKLSSFFSIQLSQESEEAFCKKVQEGKYRRVRLASSPTEKLKQASSLSATYLDSMPPLSHGRFELPHYLREVAMSSDYHRYGNLGTRDQEARRFVL